MDHDRIALEGGKIVLFGSGETSPTGRRIIENIFNSLPHSPRLALLETPAGFELNSHQVIRRVGDFFTHRLQNHDPIVELVPARKRGTPFSPDEPDIAAPLLRADLIFMGPGSPSYAIRQLRGSLAWNYLVARHRLGAVLALASAAVVAVGAYALPVYEIYKAGEELHWIEGLDFFNRYGMNLVFVPHWNNQEGGAELDTSRCFMGQERFIHLMNMLPDDPTVIGLDEKTALIIDPSRGECFTEGLGCVTIIHTGHQHNSNGKHPDTEKTAENRQAIDADLVTITKRRSGHIHQIPSGQSFSMSTISHLQPYDPKLILPQEIWQKAIRAATDRELIKTEQPSQEVVDLIERREKARQAADWNLADKLRKSVSSLGWEIIDTKDGPKVKKR